MIEQFDDQLLGEFVQNFYGYGDYSGQFWFIGMEEGGGNSFAEVVKRLDTWARRGRRELEDVAEYSHSYRHDASVQRRTQATANMEHVDPNPAEPRGSHADHRRSAGISKSFAGTTSGGHLPDGAASLTVAFDRGLAVRSALRTALFG